ncbi:MAG: aromatic-ring-hydroxylating dioxygenase subunit beta [Gammaproteobacteria bacterium]
MSTALPRHPWGDVVLPEAVQREIEAFLFHEAELADESRYAEWEALVTDDMQYWVPRGPADYDPAEGLSYVYDNRARLATRLRQLASGRRWAQTPPSPMRRVLGNIRVREAEAVDGPYSVTANFVLHEFAAQSRREINTWSGRYTYRLRRIDGVLRLAAKTVELVGGELPQRNIAFLL